MDTRSPLARRFRLARLRLHLTQAGLAAKAGLSVQLVRKIEQDTGGQPRLGSLEAFARVLGTTPGKLLG